MSKNYTNYSKPGFTPVESKEIPENADPEQIEVTQLETADPEAEGTTIPVAEVIAEELTPEEPTKQEPKTGIVTANKLNIRKLPSLNAEATVIVENGTKLIVDPNYETSEWIKVYTESGLEGYCMKQFVTVN